MKAKFEPASTGFEGFTGTRILDSTDPQVRSWWAAGAIRRVPGKKKVKR